MLTVDLHRHFEAGLRPETIARLAGRHHVTEARTRAGELLSGVDPQDPESIRRYYRSIAAGFGGPDGFPRFVDAFGLPLSVLRSTEDLEQAVFDQLVDCAGSGTLHTELRGSPFTYLENIAPGSEGARRAAPLRDLEEIAAALVAGVDRAWRERSASGTFVLAFSRQKGDRQARVVAELAARHHRADRPVGLDIAGFPETTYPPRSFVEALQPAREAGVPITVHAGEQGTFPSFDQAPPALVVEAVKVLGARRIGHGTSLAASPAARSLVHERGVGIECCPVSNQCMGFVGVDRHPLRLFLQEGLLASLATDDPLMFGPFTVMETFRAISAPLGLAADDLLQLTRNGIDTAFVTDQRRVWLRRQMKADSDERAML
jgi:adenosine deaminase